jgi:lysozyme
MNNDLLREMLKRHEGLRLKPYRCTAGKRTIGYGWNMDAHPLPSDISACLNLTAAITEEMANRLLNISIASAEAACRDLFQHFDGFSERRQAALADFVFNVGAGKAITFKNAMQAIKTGDWNRAADELMYVDGLKKDRLSDYWQQTGDRAVEIVGMIREG